MKKVDYFNNIGGLNLTDSPFVVQDNQATAGYNFEYLRTGSIRKVLGYSKVNSSANAQLRTTGLGVLIPVSGSVTQLRAAGTKLQTINTTSGALTNAQEDTSAAGTTFFDATSKQPVE